MAVGSGTHKPGVRGNRAVPSSQGIHSPEDQGMQGIQSSRGIHSPDIRKQEVRRLGIRNRCPVAAEVY